MFIHILIMVINGHGPVNNDKYCFVDYKGNPVYLLCNGGVCLKKCSVE